jgi:hypothetical protein
MDDMTARQAAVAMQPIDSVRTVRVTYADGTTVEGPIVHWGGGMLGPGAIPVTILANNVRGNPHAPIDWPRVIRVEVTFYDHTSLTVP